MSGYAGLPDHNVMPDDSGCVFFVMKKYHITPLCGHPRGESMTGSAKPTTGIESIGDWQAKCCTAATCLQCSPRPSLTAALPLKSSTTRPWNS